MVASLSGIIFKQVYGDNSGGAEFDTDGDGTPTQEDEFVSINNTSGVSVDISGWQIWSDMTGAGAPDGPQDGLYHTFPPGTVLAPGQTLYVVNEITGTPSPNMQEASEGGVESGAGGVNTNFLSEGDANPSSPESVVLVDPATGDYIVLNFSATEPSGVPGTGGFPGTTLVGESNAVTDSGVEDQNAGSSYQYNGVTDSYDYQAVVVCFAAGTLIAVPGREVPVEDLVCGDIIKTLDHGPRALCKVLYRKLDFTAGDDPRHKPIMFKPDALGPGRPRRPLVVSPQHRMLVPLPDGDEVLVPAKALTGRAGVRVMKGCRQITYVHLVFDRHEIICAEGCWSESFFPGAYSISHCDHGTRKELFDIFPQLQRGLPVVSARQMLKVQQACARF